MLRDDRRLPAWLVRRSYFKRVGRWLKPRARPEAAPTAFANVLPFPDPAKAPRRVVEMPVRKAAPA
jgi:hypothetical protein